MVICARECVFVVILDVHVAYIYYVWYGIVEFNVPLDTVCHFGDG